MSKGKSASFPMASSRGSIQFSYSWSMQAENSVPFYMVLANGSTKHDKKICTICVIVIRCNLQGACPLTMRFLSSI